MIQIFGTVGPSCEGQEILAEMIRRGMTGVRVNLSHTGIRESAELFRRIERAFSQARREPCILIDMQGPEMRIGTLAKPLTLAEGQRVRLGTGLMLASESGADSIPLERAILKKLEPGQEVRLDDGRILLHIFWEDENEVEAEVMRGGVLSSKKSIAIEGAESDFAPLTGEDMSNIRLAKSARVTGLMQPFVRGGDDLRYVREALIREGAGDIRLYAKIENLRGVNALPEILEEADEIIIARGDLGNAMPLWKLPACQKYIASCCNRAGKPFMVVTQMLSSMEHCKVPTRAEVSDIFNAVADGASSVMVTGETAVGEYPAEVIDYLARTCEEAENYRERHRR